MPVWKCPLDLWVCQELIHELTPDLIVETGTAYGSTDAAGSPSPGGGEPPGGGRAHASLATSGTPREGR